MKLRLPLAVVAFLHAAPLSMALPWQDVPATYTTTDGQTLTVSLGEDRELTEYDGIAIEGTGTLVFDGSSASGTGNHSLLFSRSYHDTQIQYIRSEATLVFANLQDFTMNNPHNVTSVGVATERLGGALHSSGSVTFTNLTGALRLNNAIFDVNDFFEGLPIAGGGAIYTSGDFRAEKIGQGVSFSGNLLRQQLVLLGDTNHFVSYIGGGAVYTEGSAEFFNINGDVEISENESKSMALGQATDEDPYDVTLATRGGAIYSGQDVIFSRLEGHFIADDNRNSIDQITRSLDLGDVNFTANGGLIHAGRNLEILHVNGDLKITNNLSVNTSLQLFSLPVTFTETALGGAFYAGESILIKDIGGQVEFTGNYTGNSIEMWDYAAIGSSYSPTIDQYSAGGAMYADGDLVIADLGQSMTVQSNAINGRRALIVKDTAPSATGPHVTLSGTGILTGGALASGGSTVIQRVKESLLFEENRVYMMADLKFSHETPGSDAMITNTQELRGGALYAGDSLLIEEAGEVTFQKNSALAMSIMDLETTLTDNFAVTINDSCVVYGGAAYARNGLTLRQLAGLNIVRNSVHITSSPYGAAGAGSSADIDAFGYGGGLASEGVIVIQQIQGLRIEGNAIHAIANAYANDATGGSFHIQTRALGGAIYAKGGLIMSELTGEVVFRANLVMAYPNFGTFGGMPTNYSCTATALGGALYLEGTNVIQNISGILLFEENQSVVQLGGGSKSGYLAGGGALALGRGGSIILNANTGDILFKNNRVGSFQYTPASSTSAGGAIYVVGGDRPGSDDLVQLHADSGRIIAFQGNISQVEFEYLSSEYIPIAGTGQANGIHLEKNAVLALSGAGSQFFADPISSGTQGGVSLVKTGSGTAYFHGEASQINGAGMGENAVRVEAGALHASAGASLSLVGEDARFVVTKAGSLSGGGMFGSQGGFLIEGALSPDSILYTLEQSRTRAVGSSLEITQQGAAMGTLRLQGDAHFNQGRLISEIDMVNGVADITIVEGSFSGAALWAPIGVGKPQKKDLYKNVVIYEVYGDVLPGASVTGSLDVGIYKVGLAYGANPNGPGTAWWTDFRDEYSSGVDVILNTAGSLAGSWFRQLDNLVKRMGELRLTPQEYPCGDVWVRTYGQQSNINLKVPGIHGFREYQYGADMGIDRICRLDKDNRLAMGLFTGYQRMDRQFHDEHRSRGNTDSILGGVYLTWLEKSGWYADFVMKAQSFDTTGKIHGSQAGKFNYDTWGLGASLEAGKTFALKKCWFIEPMIQVAWLHLDGKGYATTQGLNVMTKSSDAWQFAGQVRVGRTDYCGPARNHLFQTYVKAGVVQQVSGGGAVHIEDHSWRPNTDGTRGMAGVGCIWQHDRHQVHLDFEAGIGEKVDIPWSVNLGYRISF